MIRVPVEFPSESGGVIRGIRIPVEDGRKKVLFVHEVGRDLDEFGMLLERFAEHGYEPVAIDLPGHGLSEGNDLDLASIVEQVREIVAKMKHDDNTIGLVMSGRIATVGSFIGYTDGVVAQVLINPELDAEIAGQQSRAQSIRMILHGDGQNFAGTKTQRFFSPLLGDKMLVFNVAVTSGVSEISRVSNLLTHVELFFHRYLKPQAEIDGARNERSS